MNASPLSSSPSCKDMFFDTRHFVTNLDDKLALRNDTRSNTAVASSIAPIYIGLPAALQQLLQAASLNASMEAYGYCPITLVRHAFYNSDTFFDMIIS